ncbi:probable membrane-associated kinase regulator 4 [Zingiber officinale]|nr:probable membrane-associated kinase regulator 4 [Zingiber officinale]
MKPKDNTELEDDTESEDDTEPEDGTEGSSDWNIITARKSKYSNDSKVGIASRNIAHSWLSIKAVYNSCTSESKASSMAIDDPSMAEEGYIDMEFKSSSLIEFQFQMNSNLHKPSPADELFYKGKLLPLRLIHDQIEEKKATRTPRASAGSTPYMSCNASPAAAAAACFVGGEIGLEDFFFHDCRQEELIRPQSKRSWSQKLKSIKEAAALVSKAYLKSLLHKSWLSKVKEGSKRKGKATEIQKQDHRRSFSSSSIWQSPSKSWSSSSRNWSESSSSFSSVNSAVLKRSSSVNSDAETSIKGAIAHCKKSQQKDSSRKSSSDVGFCLLNVAKIAPDGL